jgi:hypothetical protein
VRLVDNVKVLGKVLVVGIVRWAVLIDNLLLVHELAMLEDPDIFDVASLMIMLVMLCRNGNSNLVSVNHSELSVLI